MGESPERVVECRLALGNLWMSLRALEGALPPHVARARAAIAYERSVLRAGCPPVSAVEQELGRLCNVAREVLRAHREEAMMGERSRAILLRLDADHATALDVLHGGAVASGVLGVLDADAPEKAAG